MEIERLGEEIGHRYNELDADCRFNEAAFKYEFKGIREIQRTPSFQVSYFGISNGEVYRYRSIFRSEDEVDDYVNGNAVLGVFGTLDYEDDEEHLLLQQFAAQSEEAEHPP